MDINFKQALENTIIPTIKNMIDKEEKHLEMLKKYDHINEEVKSFILYSEKNLNYLNDKLEEYTKYLKNEY